MFPQSCLALRDLTVQDMCGRNRDYIFYDDMAPKTSVDLTYDFHCLIARPQHTDLNVSHQELWLHYACIPYARSPGQT
jgi:hypothetical protein